MNLYDLGLDRGLRYDTKIASDKRKEIVIKFNLLKIKRFHVSKDTIE